jgi:hypothetical protein
MSAETPERQGPLESLYPREYFALIAGHHLRLADRSGSPAVFVFLRVGGPDDATDPLDTERAAEIVLDSVRSSDVPTMIDDRTFAILLTGDAAGAEELVLSRLVEAIAAQRRDDGSGGQGVEVSVGTAVYDPGSGVSLDAIVEGAARRLSSDGR